MIVRFNYVTGMWNWKSKISKYQASFTYGKKWWTIEDELFKHEIPPLWRQQYKLKLQ